MLEYATTAIWTALAIILVRWIVKTVISIRAIEKLPGPKFKFPLGTLYAHPTPVEHVKLIKRLSAENPTSGFRFWLGPVQAVCVLNHPQAVRAILEDEPPKAPMLYRYIQPWLGEHSLLTLEGERWKDMRRLLTPAFHLHILHHYAPVIVDASSIIIEKFLNHAKTKPEEDYDVFSDYALLTLDVICRAAFSHEGDPQRNPEDKYAVSIGQIAECIIARAINPKMMFDGVYYRTKEGKEFQELLDYVHDHADNLIDKRAKEIEGLTLDDIGRTRPGGRTLLDFLDILLTTQDENGQRLSKEAIRHQCDTFLFAGHDTTSSCLSWLSYLFSVNPEAQEKCRKEIFDAFGDEAPTYEDVQKKIPYLTCCIKEALRMYPPIPGVARKLTKPVNVGSTVLQPGTTAAVGILALHYNPTLWEEPTKFKPERFETGVKHDSYSFLPFSIGRRNCIGQNLALNEIRLAMCQILRKVVILPSAEKDYEPQPMSQIVLRSDNGVRMRFKAYEE